MRAFRGLIRVLYARGTVSPAACRFSPPDNQIGPRKKYYRNLGFLDDRSAYYSDVRGIRSCLTSSTNPISFAYH